MFSRYHLPAILWALFILIICGIPGDKLPELTFLDWLKPDKIVHLFVFGVLVILLMRSFKFSSPFAFISNHQGLSAVVITILYGIITEILQEYVFIHRYGDVRDALANAMGAFLGLWYVKKREKKT